MKNSTCFLLLCAAIVCLEAVPARINYGDLFNDPVHISEKSDTSACPYVYYLWGKKYTILCDPFCEHYNKMAACVDGKCQCGT